MEIPPPKPRTSQYSQSSHFNFDAYLMDLTAPHEPPSRTPHHLRYQPKSFHPRANSIESLSESIIELEFPSPSLCNDHEMSQYISKSYDSQNLQLRQPTSYITAFPQNTVFYLPSDSDSVRSSLIRYGEDILNFEVYDPDTRPSTILLPEIPFRQHIRHSDQAYSAPLHTSSTSTSARTIKQEPSTSPSKRSATPTQLDQLSAELAHFDTYHQYLAADASPSYSIAPPSTPTPSLSSSLSQASTLTNNSPAATHSLNAVNRSRSRRPERLMEAHIPAHNRWSRAPQPNVTDSSRTSIRHRAISQPLPSPKLPIHLPGPCCDIEIEEPLHTVPSQSKMDWSDDDDGATRRTIKAIKKAVSSTNLHATARSRSDSAAAKRPPMPSPAFSRGIVVDEILRAPSSQQQRHSNGSSTLAVRLSHASATAVADSPRKLMKKLSMKRTRSIHPAEGKAADEAATSPQQRKRTSSAGAAAAAAAASVSNSKIKGGKKVGVRRLRALLRRLRC